jgi:hypothetical protein
MSARELMVLTRDLQGSWHGFERFDQVKYMLIVQRFKAHSACGRSRELYILLTGAVHYPRRMRGRKNTTARLEYIDACWGACCVHMS